ncbi:MAG: ABC transporter ATP-binding protein [Gemmatimonadaceae bacterium]|nr:ABC transporter ATP-binding protein [Gloeobacterales cyanobacterium ES-bin-141]
MEATPAESTSVQPVIELRKVSKSFGDQHILDQVDLKLFSGEALVLVGPSGTGKSTILRIVCGLLEPDSGEVLVGGQPAGELLTDGESPVRLSMVFQQSALFDSLTVEENIGFSLFEHSRLSRDEIRDLVRQKLELVGLSPDLAKQMPAELSGGQRKRVSFARAIMDDPKHKEQGSQVLLYDEPTAGLDPIASTLIEDLIRELKQQKSCSSYVVVSHQGTTIRRTADRVIMLYQGQIQWEGTVDAIDASEDPYVRQFFDGKTEGPIQ